MFGAAEMESHKAAGKVREHAVGNEGEGEVKLRRQRRQHFRKREGVEIDRRGTAGERSLIDGGELSVWIQSER